MKLRTVAATATAVAGLLASATVALAPDALAAASCPSDHICFWQDANYGGGKFTTNVDAIANFKSETFTNGVTLNDKISSIYNNTSYPLYMFIDADFDNISGFDATCDETVPAHTARAHVRYNDKYSSELYGS